MTGSGGLDGTVVAGALRWAASGRVAPTPMKRIELGGRFGGRFAAGRAQVLAATVETALGAAARSAQAGVGRRGSSMRGGTD